MKIQSSDSTLLFLFRQHTRTEFISFAFIRLLGEDLTNTNPNNTRSIENLQAVILNALEYVKKNFKCFGEVSQVFVDNSKNHKKSKKDLNTNPFGVLGAPQTTRNSSNKENYGGNSNTVTKNQSSKSEKKMFIKQNIQISLAFLKKICRLSKTYQERFREFLLILNQIETGAQTTKVKEQIRRALNQ